MADHSAIVWLRRDLRVHDHTALHAALSEAEVVIPVFCLDDRLLSGRHASGPRVRFMLQCLGELRHEMTRLGGGLVVRHGPPEREIPQLAREVHARSLHFSYDVGEFARRRDGRVLAAFGSGIDATAHPGVFAMDDPDAIQTTAGTPYTVFTPFHRAWSRRSRRPVLPAPDELPALPSSLATGRIPALEALGLTDEVPAPLRGGEEAGRAAADGWLAGPVAGYATGRDDLDAEDGVSRLSAYLRFGSVSARELEGRLGSRAGETEYARQLAWRDFYGYVLHHFPQNGRLEHQERYRGSLNWNEDEEAFDAWRDGRTGVPLVDAGMRQLRREGWMHNRVRMVVGSFLTKDLGIDWRRGEDHFMRWLLDGDPASNNGNWQWIASVGVDPAPVYRRILSPTRQQQRFDPEGSYVRRYVPELRAVSDRHLAEPWTMSPDDQEACGCVIGRDYPAPIVDHASARRAALERYAAAR